MYEYDEQGRLARSVTRQVESEWDETNRALAEGLAKHDREVHSDGCGLHPAILAEPDVYRFKYDDTEHCPACSSRARYLRIVAEQDQQWLEKHKDVAASAKRPSDGRRTRLVADRGEG